MTAESGRGLDPAVFLYFITSLFITHLLTGASKADSVMRICGAKPWSEFVKRFYEAVLLSAPQSCFTELTQNFTFLPQKRPFFNTFGRYSLSIERRNEEHRTESSAEQEVLRSRSGPALRAPCYKLFHNFFITTPPKKNPAARRDFLRTFIGGYRCQKL